MFSVLMSVYKNDKVEYVNIALDSILNQSFHCNELVLIKDGPIDVELEECIEKYSNRYKEIKVFQNDTNLQLGRTLAKGVELCSNDIIARMDADDIACNNRFELQYCYMKNHPEVAVLGGAIEEFDDQDNHMIKNMPLTHAEILKYSRYRNPINHMTVMFRKNAVLECGNYSHFPYLEDYSLWNRMIAKGYQFANLEEVLVHSRVGREMYERRSGLNYFKSHLRLRKQQYMLGNLNTIQFFKAVVLSFLFTMVSKNIKRLVYRMLLRR